MKNYLLIFILLLSFYGCESSILEDPSTSISYSIGERSHVKLTIENSYNTLITTLVDEELMPGRYNVRFDSSNLLEGIYFYTIEAKGLDTGTYFKATKHLILVK